MADINSELNRFNGTSNDALLLRNSLEGSTDPSTATKGFVGQTYVNTVTGDTFVCKNASVGNYVWVRLCPDEIGAELAGKLGLPPTASVAEGLSLVSKGASIETGSYVGDGNGTKTILFQLDPKIVIIRSGYIEDGKDSFVNISAVKLSTETSSGRYAAGYEKFKYTHATTTVFLYVDWPVKGLTIDMANVSGLVYDYVAIGEIV